MPARVEMAAALGTALTACASSSTTKAAPLTPAPATTTAPATPAADSNLSPRQLQFVTDARSTLNFGSSVQDSALASFGQHVCRARLAGVAIVDEVPAAQRVESSITRGMRSR
jgi:hypothetical protein